MTPWFFRRMGILAAMLIFMGLFFLYDGKYGYAKDNVIAETKVWFETEFLKSFDEARDNEIVGKKIWFESEFLKGFDLAKASGKLDEWIRSAQAQGLPTGENGEPPKWPTYAVQNGWPEVPKKHSEEEINRHFSNAPEYLLEWIAREKAEGRLPKGENGEPPKWPSYAAQHGWPETPKKHSEEEIYQQFQWGGAMLLLALVVLVMVLLDRGKKLAGHEQHMIMPNGAEVRFADVYKVDKRKWDNKGLAYVFHRSGGKGGRAIIDDLKYDGAGRVLDRLLRHFKGELIEKVPEPEEADPETPVDSGAAP